MASIFCRSLPCLLVIAMFVGCGSTPKQVETEEENAFVSWLGDLDIAKARAAENGRPIFALFTGSDWCPNCIMLEKNVLTKKVFADYANEHLTLVKFDVPQMEPENEQEEKALVLLDYYGGLGVPMVVLLDAEGKLLTEYRGNFESASLFVDGLKETVDAIRSIKKREPSSTSAANVTP